MADKPKTQSAEVLLKQLKNPFDPKFVKWRVGATSADKKKGIALAYIDAREVMKRLDEVCGPENWQDALQRVDGGFIDNIAIRINGEWISRSDASGDTHVEAVKGSASGAFKRAAAKWGVGRYLYYLPTVWAELTPVGKSYVFSAETIKKLNNSLPEWAKPGQVENWEDVAELELEETATAEEQYGIMEETVGVMGKILGAETRKQLEEIVGEMTGEEQRIFADAITNKADELTRAENANTSNNSN